MLLRFSLLQWSMKTWHTLRRVKVHSPLHHPWVLFRTWNVTSRTHYSSARTRILLLMISLLPSTKTCYQDQEKKGARIRGAPLLWSILNSYNPVLLSFAGYSLIPLTVSPLQGDLLGCQDLRREEIRMSPTPRLPLRMKMNQSLLPARLTKKADFTERSSQYDTDELPSPSYVLLFCKALYLLPLQQLLQLARKLQWLMQKNREPTELKKLWRKAHL